MTHHTETNQCAADDTLCSILSAIALSWGIRTREHWKGEFVGDVELTSEYRDMFRVPSHVDRVALSIHFGVELGSTCKIEAIDCMGNYFDREHWKHLGTITFYVLAGTALEI